MSGNGVERGCRFPERMCSAIEGDRERKGGYRGARRWKKRRGQEGVDGKGVLSEVWGGREGVQRILGRL